MSDKIDEKTRLVSLLKAADGFSCIRLIVGLFSDHHEDYKWH